MTRIAMQIYLLGLTGAALGVSAGCSQPIEETATTEQHVVSGTNAKWFDYRFDGSIDLLSSSAYQRKWTNVLRVGTNVLALYDKNSGSAKTAYISSSGVLTNPKSYSWQAIWTDIVAADFKGASDANVLFYDRVSGLLKAYRLTYTSLSYRFSQTIPRLVTDTDEAIGWDIVVPFTYSGSGAVLFYQRSTGTAKFYRYNSTINQLTPWFTRSIRNYWDQIAAGDFDQDADMELVFHNQDSGKVRIWDPVDESITDLPSAGISHTALLAVGKYFGGSSQDDIMLYQSGYRSRGTIGSGRGILYSDTAAGNYTIQRVNSGWRKDWTHLVSNDFGFMLYSNAQPIKVQFVFAGLTTSQAAAEMADSGVDRWIAQADRTFAAAGLDFEIAGYSTTWDSDVVSYVCGDAREPINAWVAANIASDRLPVIVTPNNSGGCSSGRADYVAMSRPTLAGTYVEYYRGGSSQTHDAPSPRGLAHELGHYFQLAHTHATLKDSPGKVQAWLTTNETSTNHASIHNLDNDRLASTSCTGSGSCYNRAYDTMPSFSLPYWDAMGVDRCDDGPVYTLGTAYSQIEYSAAPHNVMSYIRCDQVDVLSKDQVGGVRDAIYNRRSALVP